MRMTHYDGHKKRWQINDDYGAVMIDELNYAVGEAVDKLAAYEDTGLSPEEVDEMAERNEITPEQEYFIRQKADSVISAMDNLISQIKKRNHADELLKAEAEGRLAVLPCKPEDTVYGIRKSPKYGKYVKELTASAVGVFAWKHRTDTILITTKEDYYGKTVFLTREEAEKALEAQK